MLRCFPLLSSADLLMALDLVTIASMSSRICMLPFMKITHELGFKMVSYDFDFAI